MLIRSVLVENLEPFCPRAIGACRGWHFHNYLVAHFKQFIAISVSAKNDQKAEESDVECATQLWEF